MLLVIRKYKNLDLQPLFNIALHMLDFQTSHPAKTHTKEEQPENEYLHEPLCTGVQSCWRRKLFLQIWSVANDSTECW